jgi:hypothetical protein
MFKSRRNRQLAARDMHGTHEECIAYMFVENLKERDYLEDPGVDGRLILNWVLQETGCDDMECIHLAQNRDNWRILVKTLIKHYHRVETQLQLIIIINNYLWKSKEGRMSSYVY